MIRIEYNSNEELFNIISQYIDKEDKKILIDGNIIKIYYEKIKKDNKPKKCEKIQNKSPHSKGVTEIYRAIKKLKSHNVNPSFRNIAIFLSMEYNAVAHKVNRYRKMGYNFYIDNEKSLKYKDHSLYRKMYTVWRGMVQRCYNQNHESYHRYGGRGILICDDWRYSPDNFFLDMHDTYIENSTLDRIDNDKGYSKQNCRWADNLTQHRNTSKSLKIIYENKEIHVNELLEILNIQKYEFSIKRKIKRMQTWDSYIDEHGIIFNGKEFCSSNHFMDCTNISSFHVIKLMKRYRSYDKDLPSPSMVNINFYIKNCYNFSDNLIKISKNKKLLKKDILKLIER
jgi:hypothetical protein